MGNSNGGVCCTERSQASASSQTEHHQPAGSLPTIRRDDSQQNNEKILVGGRSIERRLLTFPRDRYVLKPGTRHLFRAYARLTRQRRVPSDIEIINAIAMAYESAMRVKPYVCIKEMRFAEPRIATHPTFKAAISVSSRVSSLRLLDIGCCFGTDVRQAIVSGVLPSNVFGVDIEHEFVDSGIHMFNDVNEFRKR
jgi:hypothetical protein